ncbi:hypothetical protein GCM10011609_05920 [Lentzea pudingi]|uniref:Uncharacterized protein n=1 Tax=Lentzea pudingi TaxID=1789439 RepID=A0ABQ2HBS3_9PSEU|nr:hypothetical protein GCM10011609_05920 [Lentzea pudingi]
MIETPVGGPDRALGAGHQRGHGAIPMVVRDSDTLELDSRGLTLTRGRTVVRFGRGGS